MRMEAFRFDERLAMETESAFATVLGRLLQDALPGAGWSREDEEFAVGQDSVHVEEEELDFAGARLSGEFCHRRDFSSFDD